MKQFIYLDTDIVNSIIAQSEQGLIMSLTSENGSTSSDNIASTYEINADGSIGGKLAFLAKAEANIAAKMQTQDGVSSSDTSKEIVSKTLHDAAFDIACSQIKPNCVSSGDQSCDEEGAYLELKRTFDYIDFEYLEKLFAPSGLIEMLKKSEADAIQKAAETINESLNRETKRKNNPSIKSEIKKSIQENNQKYDNIVDILHIIRGIIPYSRMLISFDGYLVPLDDRYFRVDPANLGFKYGGQMTCVGMVTNIIGEDTKPGDDKNIFAILQFNVNELLRNLLPTGEANLCVVHPIAVYYGQ